MSDAPKLILRFSLAYLRYKAESIFGKDFLRVAAGEIPILAGQDLNFTIDKILYTSPGSEELLRAIKDADEYFRSKCISDGLPLELLQAFSMPWGDLPSIQSELSNLPQNLDTEKLERAIRLSLRTYNLSEPIIERGTELYLSSLKRSLLRLENYTLSIIGQTVLSNHSLLVELEGNIANSHQIILDIQKRIEILTQEGQTDLDNIVHLLNRIVNQFEYGLSNTDGFLSNFTVNNWLNYFHQTLDDADSFQQIIGYQEPKDLFEVTEQFLMDNGKRICVIEGPVGIGKTSYLEMMTRGWANENVAALETMRREHIVFPPIWVPVFISLRNRPFRNAEELTSFLLIHLQNQGLKGASPLPSSVFDTESIKWAFILDGLDEQRENISDRIFDAIREFSAFHRFVKIFVSTRPIIDFDRADARLTIYSGPIMQTEEILKYLGLFFKSKEELGSTELELRDSIRVSVSSEQVIEFLRSESDLWKLCSSPLFLEEIARFFIETKISLPPREIKRLRKENHEKHKQSRKNSFPFPQFASGCAASQSVVQPLPKHGINFSASTKGFRCSPSTRLNSSLHYTKRFRTIRRNSRDTLDRAFTSLDFIRKDAVMSQAFKNIIDREKSRRAAISREFDIWKSKIGELAVKTDGGVSKKFSDQLALEIVGSETRLFWMLNFGVISLVADSPGWYCFSEFSVKIHFAKSYLKPFLKEKNYDTVANLLMSADTEFLSEMMDLIADIDHPVLSNLFQEVRYER